MGRQSAYFCLGPTAKLRDLYSDPFPSCCGIDPEGPIAARAHRPETQVAEKNSIYPWGNPYNWCLCLQDRKASRPTNMTKGLGRNEDNLKLKLAKGEYQGPGEVWARILCTLLESEQKIESPSRMRALTADVCFFLSRFLAFWAGFLAASWGAASSASRLATALWSIIAVLEATSACRG